MTGPEENLWLAAVRNNPDHAANYAERWRGFIAQGRDIHGEARMIDAMADRGARILDAGCGTGRIGGWLAEHGHRVLGVDLDAQLIQVAREDYPFVRWQQGNLADFTLPEGPGELTEFDVIVCAGNVLTFLAAGERLPALTRLRGRLAEGGRLVVGFGAGRGYEFDDFRADAARAGLSVDQEYSTWQLHAPNGDFLVAVLSAA